MSTPTVTRTYLSAASAGTSAAFKMPLGDGRIQPVFQFDQVTDTPSLKVQGSVDGVTFYDLIPSGAAVAEITASGIVTFPILPSFIRFVVAGTGTVNVFGNTL